MNYIKIGQGNKIRFINVDKCCFIEITDKEVRFFFQNSQCLSCGMDPTSLQGLEDLFDEWLIPLEKN